MSAAENIRLIIKTHKENTLTVKQIAEMAGATEKNVRVVLSRVENRAKMRWLVDEIERLEARVKHLEGFHYVKASAHTIT